jgi:hypothetical protein
MLAWVDHGAQICGLQLDFMAIETAIVDIAREIDVRSAILLRHKYAAGELVREIAVEDYSGFCTAAFTWARQLGLLHS